MRDVTAAYKAMMQGRQIKSRMEIDITGGSTTLHLRDRDIVKDSLAINWRATNNKEFSLGACYATSINFTALKSVEMENAIAGADSVTITPVIYYDTGNNTEQAIPLGTYTCDNPQAFVKTTSYECLDNMLAFDKAITTRFTGLPYNMLVYMCTQCGAVLGTTSAEIGAMCNGLQRMVVDPKEVGTFRDALSYIAILLGCFCIIGDDGKLYLRRFHTSSDLDIERNRREETVFAGYRTMFKGIKCRFLADQNFYPYEHVIEGRAGIVLDVGDIPIIEDSEGVKKQILQNIYEDVLEGCSYYPCEITMVGDPSIEVGDMVRTRDRDGSWRSLLVTALNFVWRGASQLSSEGIDPKQANVTTAAKKAAQRSENMAKNNSVVTATYVNAGAVTVTDQTNAEITNLRFVTSKDLTAIFGAEIPVYSDGAGYVNITYYDNGIAGDTVTAQVHEGCNLITLVNHLHYDANRVVLLQLRAQTESITAGGTAPTLSVASDKIRSYIFAQGIEIEVPWDGIISISEDYALISSVLAVYGFTDGVTCELFDNVEASLSDTLQAVVSALQTYQFSDTVEVTLEYGDQIIRMGMGQRAGMPRVLAPLVI